MTSPKGKIKHVIVVMFENRSFDHMLGFLYKDNNNVSPLGHPFEGLTGNETNPDSQGNAIKVFPIQNDSPYSYYMPRMDPGEGFMNTNFQLFGALKPPFPKGIGPNQGFVRDFESKIGYKYFGDPPYHPSKPTSTNEEKSSPAHNHSTDYHDEDYDHWYHHTESIHEGLKIVPQFPGTKPSDIMGIYTPEMLPVMSGLAKNYAVCDHYYCSVPTETFPNRAFMHMATSQGQLYDAVKTFSAKSIFKHLTDNGHTWGIYGDGKHYTYTFTFCKDVADNPVPKNCGYGKFDDFQDALDNGTLPDYVFLEPQWSPYGNSQHPNYSVASGEEYMLKIYNAVKNSQYWEDTLLVINYDEHGGTYDHVTPPSGAAQPTPTTVNQDTGFTFDRFGVRVPCILISPWIEAGTVYRTKGKTPLDHTSILKTVETLFDLTPLTARDEAASDVLDVLTLDTVRTDDPMNGIEPPTADTSVHIPDHASQILMAQADSLTDKRNREEGAEHVTPTFQNDEEVHQYIHHWYDYFFSDQKPISR